VTLAGRSPSSEPLVPGGWGDNFHLTTNSQAPTSTTITRVGGTALRVKGPMTDGIACMGIDDRFKPQEATKVNLTYCREWCGSTAERAPGPTKSGKSYHASLHEDDWWPRPRKRRTNWVHLRCQTTTHNHWKPLHLPRTQDTHCLRNVFHVSRNDETVNTREQIQPSSAPHMATEPFVLRNATETRPRRSVHLQA